MEHTSKRSRLAPQQLREKLLKQGNKGTVEKTQPSKLTNTEKFNCVTNYQKQDSDKCSFRKDCIEAFKLIYDGKSYIEESGEELYGIATRNARKHLKLMELESENLALTPSFRPLAELIEAEERING